MSHKGTVMTPVSFSGGTGVAGMPTYAAGDRLYAIVSQDVFGHTITPPSGWPSTPLIDISQSGPDGQTVLVYEIKSATGSEGTTWTSNATNVGLITVSAYDGRHTTNAVTFVTLTVNTTSQASPISITDIAGGTAAAGDDVFMYIGTDQQSGGAVWTESGLSSGLTERASQAALAWTCGMLSSVDAVSAGTFGPVSVTLTGTTGNTGYHAVVIAIPSASGGGGPTISSTSNATPNRGSSFTVTGSGFGATQGTQSLKVGGVTQTINTWAAGSINVAALDTADLFYGVPVNVEIWDGGVLVSNSFALTSLQPAVGNGYTNIGTPNATAANRLTATPDLVSGVQTENTNASQVVVLTDGTYYADPALLTFDFRVNDPTSGWGSWGTQTIVIDYHPAGDSIVWGWERVPAGSPLGTAIDEFTTPDDADYIISPRLQSNAEPYRFFLDYVPPAGTYNLSIRAKTPSGTGHLTVKFYDAGGSQVGSTSTQAITSVLTTYTLSVTLSGAATYAQIEVTT